MTRNWAGTYSYTAPTIARPTSIDEVRGIVSAGGRVRALGTRHSFTDLPDTTGTLVDVTALPSVFALGDGMVTVAAGTRYGELAMWLEERGLALPNLGSLPHINVGGAISTGTHGSGDGNGVLSTAVAGLRYVGAGGDLHDVRRGDPDLDALVVGLGAYGIVVSVSLDVVPSFALRQDVYAGVSWDAALADLDAVTGAGYSVSVFSRWDPESIGYVWMKSTGDVPETLLDGIRMADARSPLGAGDNITVIDGSFGPWMLRLPHFRLDAEPSFGDEIQSEYFVDRAVAADALRAVRELGDGIRPSLIWTELRTAARDRLWLSGAYERDAVAIHFTWHNRPVEVTAAVDAIEAALEPFAARPHWGKFHRFDAARIAAVHPRLADARAVFTRLDPAGVFSNAHLERLGVR